jgi:hypothetical protein
MRPFPTLRLFVVALVAAAVALGACVPGTEVVDRSAVPAEAEPTATPPDHAAVLRHFAAKDIAFRSGNAAALGELLDPAAPEAFRAAQTAMLAVAAQRAGVPTLGRQVVATRARGDLLEAEYLEYDDQDRTRMLRAWFSGPLDALRQTEPALATLGEVETQETADFSFSYRALDRAQVEAVRAQGGRWLRFYAGRLGERYAPRGKIEVRFVPTFEGRPERLPPLASAAVTGGVFYVLSSSTMITADGPAAYWSTVVVGHELAHVLLRGRRSGGFLLTEGLPLWLTGDRREDELSRLRDAGALWDLPRLLAGPRADGEYFAAYAQASSFVRFVAERHGENAPVALWEAAARQSTFDAATRDALGLSAAALYADWREALASGAVQPVPRAA